MLVQFFPFRPSVQKTGNARPSGEKTGNGISSVRTSVEKAGNGTIFSCDFESASQACEIR